MNVLHGVNWLRKYIFAADTAYCYNWQLSQTHFRLQNSEIPSRLVNAPRTKPYIAHIRNFTSSPFIMCADNIRDVKEFYPAPAIWFSVE
jgi:hypothetical protein